MRRATKFISILVSVIMLMQLGTVAFAEQADSLTDQGTATFEIDTVNESDKVIDYIEVVDAKLTYYKGYFYRTGDFVIEVIYTDGSCEKINVTEDMLSGFETNTVGSKVVTINYGGFSTELTIEVRALPSSGGSGGGVKPPIVVIKPDNSNNVCWSEDEFGTLLYTTTGGSAFHRIKLDNGEKTYTQTRTTSDIEQELSLNMSSALARTGSGTYSVTLTSYVSKQDQTVLSVSEGPSITYTEPTTTLSPLPTVKGGDGYVEFANYENVGIFFQWVYIKYSHNNEMVDLWGQGLEAKWLDEQGRYNYDPYEIEELYGEIDYLHEQNPVTYNKEYAQIYLEHTAIAKDIRLYRPYVMDGVFVNLGSSLASGVCGDNVRYSLSADGTFTISGEGAMYDFDQSEPPYADYFDMITSVVVEEGVTHIGEGAFAGYDRIISVVLPSTLLSIGEAAFIDCYDLTTVDATKCTKLEDIYSEAFANCALDRFDFKNKNTNIWDGAFEGFNGTFYGYEDSSAQQFAQKHDMAFELLEGTPAVDRTTVSEEYYEAAKVIYDLSIVEDVYDSAKDNVTRGEFAIAVTALLGGKANAEALKDKEQFEDIEVGTYLNGCARFLCNKGVMSTVDGVQFNPDDEILYQDILIVLVNALGYGEYAKTAGGYPYGYIATAYDVGLNKNINANATSAITTEQLAQILYNALEANLMEQTSWGYNATYEITDNTILYNYLGYTKALGRLTVNGAKATIDGRAFDIDNLKGRFDVCQNLEVADADAKDFNGKDVKAYIRDGILYSAYEYYGGEVIINDGAEETDNPVVDLQVIGYSYTKYKIGDGEYKPLPAGAFKYTLDTTDGKKTLSVTFANDDESKTTVVKSSIKLNNKRNLIYKVNGEVYQTKTVGVGTRISPLQNPKVEGYKFNGWVGLPADLIMPDYDLTVTADLTKLTKVTAKFVYNDAPLTWVRVTDNIAASSIILPEPDAQGVFTAYMEPGERMLYILAYNGLTSKSIPLSVQDTDIDLGTIIFDNTSATASISYAPVKSVAIPDSVLTSDDEAYASQSANNAVFIDVNVAHGGSVTTEMKDKLDQQYPDYAKDTIAIEISAIKRKLGTDNNTTYIDELPDLVSIKVEIPEDLQHKSDFVVVREHQDEIQFITNTPNADGEYLEIDGRYAIIHANKFSKYALAGDGFRFANVIRGFDYTDKKVAEVSLGSGNNTKSITIGGLPLYYSPQRKAYVGLVKTAHIGEGNRALSAEQTDVSPTLLVYGNVDGNYNYTSMSQAVSNGDLLNLRLCLSGKKPLEDRNLLAADVNGDGRLANADYLSLRLFISKGTPFPILK